ncbi:TPA: hypothetical protein ACFRHD_001197 [Neisseria lactamica]
MPSEAFRRHFYQMQNTLLRTICRHSREGGNPDLSVQKFIGLTAFHFPFHPEKRKKYRLKAAAAVCAAGCDAAFRMSVWAEA